MTAVFDDRAFYNELNRIRKARGIAWNRVATRAGVTASAINGYTRQFEVEGAPAKTLSIDNIVKLLAWLNTFDISQFVVDESTYDN